MVSKLLLPVPQPAARVIFPAPFPTRTTYGIYGVPTLTTYRGRHPLLEALESSPGFSLS